MPEAAQRKLVDSRGSFCPGPITDLFKAYRAAKNGDEIELWATDPAARPDVEAWAKRTGNAVVEAGDAGGYLRIVVRVTAKKA